MDFNLTPQLSTFLLFEWIVRIIMLFIVPIKRKPSSANAWLLLIIISPTLGAILFYLFGDPKLPRSRRETRKAVDLLTQKELDALRKDRNELFAKIAENDRRTLARLATVLGGLPPMNGSSVKLYSEYDESIKELISEIKKAKKYIHLEFFIATKDKTTEPVFDALADAVNRGVKVRFLYDRLLSFRYPGHRAMRRTLRKIGVETKEMLPLNLLPGRHFTRPDLRNHRKIVVIDGQIAFSGSQNLIDRTYHRKDGLYYEELVVKFSGPIVWQFNNVFRADWYSETNQALLDLVEDEDMPQMTGNVVAQVLPSGPAHEHDNNLKFYTSMVHSAKLRVGIVVPYFIPDESFLEAITAAAQRGVDVTMINSEAIDKILVGHAQRSYYEELLESGVKIYLYKKPAFLHTKQVLIDNDVAILGSSNLDIRSFQLDLEITSIIYDRNVVANLEKIEEKYRKNSEQISLKKWQKRSIRLRMLDGLSRLTAALQ